MLRFFFGKNSGNSCHQREMLCKPFITGWIPEAKAIHPKVRSLAIAPVSHILEHLQPSVSHQSHGQTPPFCPRVEPHVETSPGISRGDFFFTHLFGGLKKNLHGFPWVVGVQVGRFLSPQPSCKSETSMVSESRTSAP